MIVDPPEDEVVDDVNVPYVPSTAIEPEIGAYGYEPEEGSDEWDNNYWSNND